MPHFRLLSVGLAAATFLAAVPASAIPLYRAGLAAPATTTMMVRDVRWVCTGSACAAPRTASSPDVNVCSAMVRKLGPVTRFEADDRAFDAAQLAKCNAAAR